MQVNRDSYSIEMLTPGGAIHGYLSVTEFDDRDDWLLLRLEFSGDAIEVRTSSCWDGLNSIRQQLEEQSIIPVCYGASENVHASGMSASMGRGDRAYKLTLGVAGRTADLVGIFEAGPDVRPATVAQQAAFYERWLASLSDG